MLLVSPTRATVAADSAGWVRLRPSARLFAFALLCVPFAILFTAMRFLAFFAENLGSRLGFLILGPPLAALMWFGIYGVFIVRTRFNSAGIEYRGLTRGIMIPWNEVQQIRDSAAFGAYVTTARGPLIVRQYFRGFRQFVAEAARHGVDIDLAMLNELTPGGSE